MTALQLNDYQDAIPDLRWLYGDWLGTCPACHQGRFEYRIYRSEHGDPVCSHGCTRPQIEAAVRSKLSSPAPPSREERPPHPAQRLSPPPSRNGKQSAKPSRKIEGFTAAQLVAMDLPEPKYAVPGIVCQGLNILAGGQKLGKSWMGLGVGIAVATGGVALGTIGVLQGDVLCLALEDTKRRLKERLLKLLQGEPAPERLTLFTEWPRLDEHGLDWLRSWLKSKPEARLVIIDTLKKVRGPRSKNGNVYDEDYDVIGSLKEIADEFEVAILVLHHVRKASAEDVFDMVSGSIGLTGAADATLVLTRARGQKQGLLHLTGRDVEEQADEDAIALEWDPHTGGWTVIGKAADIQRSNERREILDMLERIGQPLSPKEIAADLDKNVSTLTVLLMKMVQSGEVEKVGYGKYQIPSYSIPIKSVKSVKSSGDDENDHSERWQ